MRAKGAVVGTANSRKLQEIVEYSLEPNSSWQECKSILVPGTEGLPVDLVKWVNCDLKSEDLNSAMSVNIHVIH